MGGMTALLVATLLTIGLLAAVPAIRWTTLRKPRPPAGPGTLLLE